MACVPKLMSEKKNQMWLPRLHNSLPCPQDKVQQESRTFTLGGDLECVALRVDEGSSPHLSSSLDHKLGRTCFSLGFLTAYGSSNAHDLGFFGLAH